MTSRSGPRIISTLILTKSPNYRKAGSLPFRSGHRPQRRDANPAELCAQRSPDPAFCLGSSSPKQRGHPMLCKTWPLPQKIRGGTQDPLATEQSTFLGCTTRGYALRGPGQAETPRCAGHAQARWEPGAAGHPASRGQPRPPSPLGTQRPALGITPRSPHNARATLSDSGFSQTGSKARPFFRIARSFHHGTQKSHRLAGKGLGLWSRIRAQVFHAGLC